MQHLQGSFVPHKELPGKEKPVHVAVYRLEELLGVIDDPSCEGRPGDPHAVKAFPVFLLPVQRIAVAVFLVHDPGNSRSRRHALHHVGLPVLALYDIRSPCVGLLAGRASIVLRIIADNLNISGNYADLLADKLLADVLQLRPADRAGALVFINIEVFFCLPAEEKLFKVVLF